MLKNNLAELAQKAASNCTNRGAQLIGSGESACQPLLSWLHYLEESHASGTADCLLLGTASAARESVACLALGLVRPALNSLRLEIDLSLAWLYFKDHPVEWGIVQDSGDGFKLKSELLKYLIQSFPKFGTRLSILRDCKTRVVDEPYRLLSAHVHGQSEFVLPQVQKPQDVIAPAKAQDEVVLLQGECGEYITDVFWSVFADSWAGIPMPLRAAVDARFKSPDQRAAFFE